jgi:hypothetical protein
VGAAAASLGGATREQPLTLFTSTSWIGHAEPAAGVLGLLHAASAVTQHASLPLLHLRTVNPFVASALVGAPGAWSLPRQQGPRPLGRPAEQAALSGVSSFAFQGTNAHALVQGLPASSGAATLQRALAASGGSRPWRRARFWFHPPASPLACSFRGGAAGGKTTVLVARLHAPALASLLGCSAQGRHLLPVAVPAMALAAAARMLVADAAAAPVLLERLAVQRLALPAGGSPGGLELHSAVEPASGAASAWLTAPSTASRQQLLSASLAAAAAAAAPAEALAREPDAAAAAAAQLLAQLGVHAEIKTTAAVAELQPAVDQEPDVGGCQQLEAMLALPAALQGRRLVAANMAALRLQSCASGEQLRGTQHAVSSGCAGGGGLSCSVLGLGLGLAAEGVAYRPAAALCSASKLQPAAAAAAAAAEQLEDEEQQFL